MDTNPTHKTILYFQKRGYGEEDITYVPRQVFDNIKLDSFNDGPDMEVEEYGDPYYPYKQAFGIIKWKEQLFPIYTNLINPNKEF